MLQHQMINRMENRTVVLDWLKDQQNYKVFLEHRVKIFYAINLLSWSMYQQIKKAANIESLKAIFRNNW